MAPAARLRVVEDRLTCGLFALFLGLPTVLHVVADPSALSETENRTLAPLPEWRWDREALGEWPNAFDAYYNDHFALRAELLEHYQLFRLSAYRLSPTRQVILGDEGFLFLRDSVRSFAPLPQAKAAAFAADLERRRAWLERRGVRYLFALVPDKTDVYPELLPAALEREKLAASRIDTLARQAARSTEARILNLAPPLRAAKSRNVLYFRNDPHWNHFGSYLAYVEIMAAVADWFPELETVAWDDLGIEAREVEGGGLARMLGLESHFTERTWQVTAEQRFGPDVIVVDIEPYADVGPDRTRDPQGTLAPGKPLVLLVFHDSYGAGLKPYLSRSFGRVVYVFERPGMRLFEKLVRREKPDLVIEQRVSRLLGMPPTEE
jgi:hypothetical protein